MVWLFAFNELILQHHIQMIQQKKSDVLLAAIREGKPLVSAEKLNLIIGLSVPSILAQITSVLMFFIDQAMVGRISVEASAACGLVESSTWLFGSLTSAASMGFSVQVAHFIGANDFSKARQVFRHGLFCTLLLSIVIAIVGLSISRHAFLPVVQSVGSHAQVQWKHADTEHHEHPDVCDGRGV